MADEQSSTKPVAPPRTPPTDPSTGGPGNPAVAVPQNLQNPSGTAVALNEPIDNTVAMEGRKAYIVREGKEFSAIGPMGRRDFQAGETIQLPPETAQNFSSHLYDAEPDERTPVDMMPPPPPPKGSEEMSPAERQAALARAGQQVPQQTAPGQPVQTAPQAPAQPQIPSESPNPPKPPMPPPSESPAEKQAEAAAPKPAPPKT